MNSNQFENTNKDSDVITTYNTLWAEVSTKITNAAKYQNDFIKGIP